MLAAPFSTAPETPSVTVGRSSSSPSLLSLLSVASLPTPSAAVATCLGSLSRPPCTGSMLIVALGVGSSLFDSSSSSGLTFSQGKALVGFCLVIILTGIGCSPSEASCTLLLRRTSLVRHKGLRHTAQIAAGESGDIVRIERHE